MFGINNLAKGIQEFKDLLIVVAESLHKVAAVSQVAITEMNDRTAPGNNNLAAKFISLKTIQATEHGIVYINPECIESLQIIEPTKKIENYTSRVSLKSGDKFIVWDTVQEINLKLLGEQPL